MINLKYLNRMALVTTLVVGLVGCGDTAETTEDKIEKSQPTQMEFKSTTETLTKEQQAIELANVLKESQEKIKANPNMNKEAQEQLLIEAISGSKGMQSQFEKVKSSMPKMVEAMKFGKECLSKAESKPEAKRCMDKIDAKIKESGIDEEDTQEEDFNWSPEDKKQMLAEIDESITEMEGRLPCIEKANNMMDMMNCSQH